jgi:hypothetical protein
MEHTTHTTAPLHSPSVCIIPDTEGSGVTLAELTPATPVKNFQEAMDLARAEARKHMEEFMLMSWFDRDRNVESPPNTTESAGDELTGYVYYGINHGAKLKVDVEQGRFVFFFTPVEF